MHVNVLLYRYSFEPTWVQVGLFIELLLLADRINLCRPWHQINVSQGCWRARRRPNARARHDITCENCAPSGLRWRPSGFRWRPSGLRWAPLASGGGPCAQMAALLVSDEDPFVFRWWDLWALMAAPLVSDGGPSGLRWWLLWSQMAIPQMAIPLASYMATPLASDGGPSILMWRLLWSR